MNSSDWGRRRERAGCTKIGEVLPEVVGAQRAAGSQMVVIDIVETGNAVLETSDIDIIRRDEQAKIVRVRGGEDVGHDLRLGAGQRVIGGQPRAGGVGDGGDGAAFTAAEGQEGDGHDVTTPSRMSVMMRATPF